MIADGWTVEMSFRIPLDMELELPDKTVVMVNVLSIRIPFAHQASADQAMANDITGPAVVFRGHRIIQGEVIVDKQITGQEPVPQNAQASEEASRFSD